MKIANIITKIAYKVLQREPDFAQVTASWTFRSVH